MCAAHEREVRRRERRQVGFAFPGRGEQHARFDPRVGQVLFLPGLGVEGPQAQQGAGRVTAE